MKRFLPAVILAALVLSACSGTPTLQVLLPSQTARVITQVVEITSTPEPTILPSQTARVETQVVVVTATTKNTSTPLQALSVQGVKIEVTHFCDAVGPVAKWTINGGRDNAQRGFEVKLDGRQIASALLNSDGYAEGNNPAIKGAFMFYLDNFKLYLGEVAYDFSNVTCP